MKIFISILVGLGMVWLTCIFFFGDEDENKVEKKEYVETPTPTPTTQVVTPENSVPAITGWNFTGTEGGYSTYEPTTGNKETEWFPIGGWKTTFAISSCIMQFKTIEGEIISFGYNHKSGDKYLINEDGSYSDQSWDEYEKVGLKSTAVAFKPAKNEPFQITVGRKKF